MERDKNLRSEIKGSIDGISKYDTVFIDYPMWWSILPMPIYTVE